MYIVPDLQSKSSDNKTERKLHNMSLEQIKEFCLYGSGIVFVFMTLVQITPIKLNPWSWLGRCIGRAINGEVIEKVNKLTQDVKDMKETNEEEWVTLSRSHILRFGDELLHGVKHSKEHFDQILIDVSKYEVYCKTHPSYTNDVATATIKQIRKIYNECLDKHDFL